MQVSTYIWPYSVGLGSGAPERVAAVECQVVSIGGKDAEMADETAVSETFNI